jgi:hypothetical protein
MGQKRRRAQPACTVAAPTSPRAPPCDAAGSKAITWRSTTRSRGRLRRGLP